MQQSAEGGTFLSCNNEYYPLKKGDGIKRHKELPERENIKEKVSTGKVAGYVFESASRTASPNFSAHFGSRPVTILSEIMTSSSS